MTATETKPQVGDTVEYEISEMKTLTRTVKGEVKYVSSFGTVDITRDGGLLDCKVIDAVKVVVTKEPSLGTIVRSAFGGRWFRTKDGWLELGRDGYLYSDNPVKWDYLTHPATIIDAN